MKGQFKFKVYTFLFFLLLSVYAYFRLWEVFFQQDEWLAFGQVISANHGAGPLIAVSGSHLVPLENIFVYVFFNLFHLQYYYYAFLSLTLHAVNSFFVFLLGYKLTKSNKIALLAGSLFAIANTAQQAVTWYAAIFSILPATFFVLVSLLFFIDFLSKKKIRYLSVSLLALLVSLLFKEDAMFFFFLYVVWILFVGLKNPKKPIALIISFIFLYFVPRTFLQFAIHSSVKFSTASEFSLRNIIYHLFIFPPKGFVQTIFSQKLVIEIGRSIVNINQNFFSLISPINSLELFVELYLVNYVLIALLMVIIALLIIFFKFSSNKNKSIAFLLILITFGSLFPLIFLPQGLDIESRHLYLPMVGGSLLMAFLGSSFFLKYNNFKVRFGIICALLFYVFYNINANHEQIIFLRQISAPRISLIHQLRSKYQIMPLRVVFLAQGDPLPLQSGPGEMLLVLLSNKNNYDYFLVKNFLWDKNDGYQESAGRGFGFFYDKTVFTNVYKKYHLQPQNVVSFKWDNRNLKLTDMTKSMRAELQ